MPNKLHVHAKQMARACNSFGTYGYTPTRRHLLPFRTAPLSLRNGTFAPTFRRHICWHLAQTQQAVNICFYGVKE